MNLCKGKSLQINGNRCYVIVKYTFEINEGVVDGGMKFQNF